MEIRSDRRYKQVKLGCPNRISRDSFDRQIFVILKAKRFISVGFSQKFCSRDLNSLGICATDIKIAGCFADDQTEYVNDYNQELQVLCLR